MFKLRLKNYRGFLNEEITFSRVNVLIGENSAGKSSILKFLLALKQSLRGGNSREYNLTLSGELTDLGNYYEVIYNHEIERNLGFAFEFREDYFDFFLKDAVSIVNKNGKIDATLKKEIEEERSKITQYLGGKILTPTTLSFELSNDLANHQTVKTNIYNATVGNLQIIHHQNAQELYIKGENAVCSVVFDIAGTIYQFDEIEYSKNGFLSIIDSDSLNNKIKHNKKFETEEAKKNIFWSIAFLLISQNYVETLLRDFKYINPIAQKIERVYLKRDKKINFNIKDIEEVVYLLSGENFLEKKSLESFKDDYTKLLSNFGIVDDIKLNIENFTRELRVVVRGVESNIKDVGFGVSLQMPIFAQAMISNNTLQGSIEESIRRGEVLLIEQPEVHLHPRLQAEFINTLLSIGENNIYIIETHSEHIIRKLQVLVKEGKYNLKPENVSINYFRKDGIDMIKTEHNINNDGILKPNFPKGFYDVSYNLALNLMD
jgi:predicted ATPase